MNETTAIHPAVIPSTLRLATRATARWLGLPVAALYMSAGATAAAPPAGLGEPQDTAPSPEQISRISLDADRNSDAAIAGRLRNIFRKIEGLDRVSVTVDSGVVHIAGAVADSADIDRAEDLAARLEGVVAVESDLARPAASDSLNPVARRLKARAEHALAMLPLFVLALGIIAIFWIFARVLGNATGIWRRVAHHSFLADLLSTTARIVVVLLGIVLALEILGAATLLGAILGSAGLVGLAIGFAVKDTVDNYVSSLMLSIRHPFRANDHVVIGDKEGRVIRLTSRATILMTLDGNHLRIPNSTVFRAEILNYTRNPERRFHFALGVDANDDPGKAMEVGVRIMRSLPFVLAQPAPTARLEKIGDSNIELCFLAWIDQTQVDWFKARSATIRAVKNELETCGFGLPEPIYRLRFDSDNPLLIQHGARSADTAGKPPSKAPSPASSQDVSIDDGVKAKVDEERATETGGDILNADRPIE